MQAKRPRHSVLPDDSVSDVTDLDKEEVLAKYYEDKLSGIDKKKRERAETRARLMNIKEKAASKDKDKTKKEE